MGHIRVISNRRYDQTCTTSTNLIENGMKSPAVRRAMEYTESREMSTLIVSGMKHPWQAVDDRLKTKLPVVRPENKGIDSISYRFKKMGRIQQPSVVISQVGTSGANGDFSLLHKDALLYEGMIVTFADDRYKARVQENPEGDDANGYIVRYQAVDNQQFDANLYLNIQAGEKTVWGGYTAYENKSLRGYSRAFYPDDFISHMTTQRKSYSMDGDALTDGVVWYVPMNSNGTVSDKAEAGWRFVRERQSTIQFMLENEYAKWWGQSTMKTADGTLRTQSTIRASKTGEFVTMGDGIEAQIEGENELLASGADGMPTEDDFEDLILQCVKRTDQVKGRHFYAVTGSEGYSHAQKIMAAKWSSLNAYFTQVYGKGAEGGMTMDVGVDFNTINFGGNSLTFVQHPYFDNEDAWTLRTLDGGHARSRTYYILDASMNSNGIGNLEILCKEAFGINRSMVQITLNGITGYDAPAVTQEDAITFAWLKQDMIVAYNTSSCGIIRPAA